MVTVTDSKRQTATDLQYLTSECSTVHAWTLLIFYDQTYTMTYNTRTV